MSTKQEHIQAVIKFEKTGDCQFKAPKFGYKFEGNEEDGYKLEIPRDLEVLNAKGERSFGPGELGDAYTLAQDIVFMHINSDLGAEAYSPSYEYRDGRYITEQGYSIQEVEAEDIKHKYVAIHYKVNGLKILGYHDDMFLLFQVVQEYHVRSLFKRSRK